MNVRTRKLIVVILVAVAFAGCASGRAFRRGQEAARLGDWDTAVAYYRQALIDDPDRLEIRVALERATQSASIEHMGRARRFEEDKQYAQAIAEYRRVVELDPRSQIAAAKAAELEKVLREQVEAARPRPEIEALREKVRRETESLAVPLQQPLPTMSFKGTALREVLTLIASAANVNIVIDPAASRDPAMSSPVVMEVQNMTLDQLLRQLSRMYALFYAPQDGRTVVVAMDQPAARAKYEDLFMQTFYISHAKAAEVGNMLTAMVGTGAGAGAGGPRAQVIVNDVNNSVTVRGSLPVLQLAERLVRQNDRPKAEIVLEVSILEVDRNRAKLHGLDLSQYALGVTLSPELAPPNTATTPDAFPAQPPPINLNTVSRGVSTNDFYLTMPSALIRFLETDTSTRLLAKPTMRGQADKPLTLNLGDEIPVPTTTFGQAAAGGIASIPISQFNYRPVGVNIEATPKVSLEGDITLDLNVEISGLGTPVTVAGQTLPAFTSRKAKATIRLRDGESNMLAGLLREDERRALRGFSGLLRVPILRELLTSNDRRIEQSDVVMLLTPRIVRTGEITADDLRPISVGTAANIGLTSGSPLLPQQPIVIGAADAPATAPRPGTAVSGVPREPIAAAPGVPTGTVVPPANAVNRPIDDIPRNPANPNPAVPPEPAAAATPVQVSVVAPTMTPGQPASVPITITNASRLTQVSVSVSYNPALVRARAVQQGNFMAQGNAPVVFLPVIDEAAGRVDIVMSRTGDANGAAGTGLLASIQFDVLTAGEGTLAVSGAASGPDGRAIPLVFSPGAIRIR